MFSLSFQAAHADIESHGQLIKTVVELCEKYNKKSQQKQRYQDSNNVRRHRQSIRHPPRVNKNALQEILFNFNINLKLWFTFPFDIENYIKHKT